MNTIPSKLDAIIYTSIKILILAFLIYFIGFFKGSILYYLLSKTYTFLMNFLFKLERCSFLDLMFINEANSVSNMNIGAVFNLETINNIEDIKTAIISRLFKKNPKLSSKVIVLLGEYFFDKRKTYSEKELLKQFKEVELSRDELNLYCEEVLNKHFDIFNDIGLEFHIIKFKKDGKYSKCQINQKSQGAILMKINHLISDGMGVVNLVGFMDDQFSINKFPRFLKKEKVWFFKIIFNEIYLFILAFTYGLYIFAETAKEGKPAIFSDIEINGEKYDNRNLVISNVISVDMCTIKEYSKKEKISINEIVVDVVYRAMFKNYPNSNKISGIIPINYSSLAENISTFHIKNSSSAIRFTVDSPYDEVKARNKVRKIVKSDILLSRIFNSILKLLTETISIRFLSEIKKETATDICFSNVPCQEDYMFIAGNKIIDIYPLAESNTFMYEFLIGSYVGKLYILVSTKKKFGSNINSIIKSVEDELIMKNLKLKID